jgi:hypothetical protein
MLKEEGKEKMVFWRLPARSHARHQSDVSVADEAARSLKSPQMWRKQPTNIGGVNNGRAAVGAVLKIVEV